MKVAGLLGVVALLTQCIFVAAQAPPPECGTKCLIGALQSSTCAPNDVPCICADATLQATAGACVLQTCSVVDALASRNASATMCNEPVRDVRKIPVIMTAVCGSFAVLFIGVRALVTDQTNAVEMLCVLLGFLAAVPLVVMVAFYYIYGLGKDIWTLSPHSITMVIKAIWVGEFSYVTTLCFTRMSFLFFYLRIFPRTTLRRLTIILIVVNTLHGLSFALAVIFNCRPISFTWTKWRQDGEVGSCTNINAVAWSHAATTIAMDLCVIALPMPELWGLRVGRKKKISIMLLFGVAFFITIVSVLRLQALVSYSTSTNPTYDNTATVYWSVLETYVCIICSCLPSFRAWLKRVAPGLVESRPANSSYGASGGKKRFPNNYHRRDYSQRVSSRENSSCDKGILKTVTNIVTRDAESEIELVDVEEQGSRSKAFDDRTV
ncbi:hypothetical protein EJ05DRAFT_17211 [Pseudovirgaria hyperparasitica]|uniref:CFEM domain-containing protein n=1 Tax=Pseudovirgaria hyperparasitica TaxID=470096 RepID=A0A6A6WKY3_9PEZI|nr:uncharacterized protein EJ05DRAFT_17211 [Pseudovirgaria hyperparasitica]KAF2762848.1 hypothetical protein EJ05DRAFT_17211 [Pseudovirgaria hyperparasitica]